MELKAILESLIFASDRPLSVKQLASFSESESEGLVTLALAALEEEHRDRGVQLCATAGGYLFRTHPDAGPWVRRMLSGRPQRLTRAMLETLAIVAYRQPVTRPEMEEIRGVDCGGVLRILLERQLIRIVGKKEEVGRPLLYGTTRQFLEFFNLRDLKDLPTLKEFSELSAEHAEEVESRFGEAEAGAAAAVLGRRIAVEAVEDSETSAPSETAASEIRVGEGVNAGLDEGAAREAPASTEAAVPEGGGEGLADMKEGARAEVGLDEAPIESEPRAAEADDGARRDARPETRDLQDAPDGDGPLLVEEDAIGAAPESPGPGPVTPIPSSDEPVESQEPRTLAHRELDDDDQVLEALDRAMARADGVLADHQRKEQARLAEERHALLKHLGVATDPETERAPTDAPGAIRPEAEDEDAAFDPGVRRGSRPRGRSVGPKGPSTRKRKTASLFEPISDEDSDIPYPDEGPDEP